MKHFMLVLVLGVALVHADRRLTQDAVKPPPVSVPGTPSNATYLPAVPKSYIPVMAHSTYTRMGNYFMPSGLEAEAGELEPSKAAAVPKPVAAAVPKPTAAAVPKPGAQTPRKPSTPTLVWPGPIKGEEALPRVITRP